MRKWSIGIESIVELYIYIIALISLLRTSSIELHVMSLFLIHFFISLFCSLTILLNCSNKSILYKLLVTEGEFKSTGV